MDETTAANPYETPRSEDPTPVSAVPRLQDPTTLAWWACGLYALTQLLSLVTHAIQTTAPGDALNDVESPVFLAYMAGLLAATILLVISGIIYLCWKFRAASNARTLDPLLAVSPGMAVGGYFIPFANLFIPYRAMASIARITRAGEGLVGPWWALHLISSFLGIAVVKMAPEGDWIGPPEDIEHLSIGMDLASALVSILLVLKITRAQSTMVRGQG